METAENPERVAPDWNDALARASAHAPFLARSLERQPGLADLLAAGEVETALDWARARGEHDDVGIALRRHRLALATTLAIADLAGAFPLARVLHELTGFADNALDTAIRTVIADRTGEARSDGFIALALGKQGAGELNYSSDIDPILIYDPDRLPRRERDDPGEAAQRYARAIVKLLSETTIEGYVLRVDLRLRPASEISPLAVPRASALSHYQGEALAWERAAFIRARAAAGDIAAGEAFLNEIAPFVWRYALDYGAVEAIRDLTQRIRANHDGPERPGPGFDVKRGRGGIREIEFYAQTHQLIHGGRDPSLRVRGTRAALDALARAGRIAPEAAQTLGEGYDRLRVIEHRLQMTHDRQTHSLPEGEALDAVARLDGLDDGAALVRELEDLTQGTAALYDRLIGEPAGQEAPPPEPSERVQRLARLGFANPEQVADQVEGWRDGRYPAIRSPQALEAFDALLPSLLEEIGKSDDPDHALIRWEKVIDQAGSAINLFRLCAARPVVLKRLVATLTLAPTLAEELGRRPESLDVLIDLDPAQPLPEKEALASRMESLARRGDYEAKLDAIRRVTGEERFALGVRLIEGHLDPRAIASGLCSVAEAAIVVAGRAATAEFARDRGTIANSELVMIGLGRLGGGALTHFSDLDVVYLFTGDFAAKSDGERPLGATLYYNRLAGRIGAALAVPTAEGAMYEVDTRLRPQGNQGPLAVSLDSFARYQLEQAWTWEHMALTRARVLIGSDEARNQVEAVIGRVLSQNRDPRSLRADVVKMRADMAQHKPARGPLDAKLLRGGLVDVEFLVQFLQLRDGPYLAKECPAALDPDLARAIPALADRGRLSAELAGAYDLLSDLLVAGRLLANDAQRPPPAAAAALAHACERDHYDALTRDLSHARQIVAGNWRQTFEQELEID